MTLTQHLVDLTFDVVHHPLFANADHDDVHGTGDTATLTQYASSCRGQRYHDDVVLVLAGHGLTLGAEYANDLERNVVDAQRLANDVAGTEQFFGHRVTQQRHLGAGTHLPRVHHAPFAHHPIAGNQIVLVYALHGCRPIVVAHHNLHAAAHRRGSGRHFGYLVFQRLGIAFRQTRAGATRHARTAPPVGTRHHHEQVGTERCDLLVDLFLRACTHRQHGDHRRDANDDA